MAAAVTEERKMVTVLFADLAGSTELASRLDPERFREVMADFYRMVSTELASLRGRAEKFVGDAAMAVWGVPHAHEDDALRAIRAGLMIRDRTVRLGEELSLPLTLQVRVGIASGEVATGSGPADQLLVSGPTVNVAARLQQAAEPGEILAGETTVALARDSVAFGPPREEAAKGFDEAVYAWPVLSISQRSSRRTIPLVGRRRELALLRDTFERVREASRAHLITLLGEPGIGKTRLVEEFISGVPEDTRVLSGRASDFEEDVTFAAIAEMIRREIGIDRGAAPADVREHLEGTVEGCCDPSEVDRVVARLGLALGLGEESGEGHRYRGAEIRGGFQAFLDGLARTGPVVLNFDDMHLAQPELLDLIQQLLERARQIPLLVLCVARDELMDVRPGWGGGLGDSVSLRLEPLSDREAVELAKAAGEDLDEDTAARVARHAGGNPFFIVETTGMLLQEHLEHLLGAQHSHLLPPTVQAVVASRIDHLPDGAKDLFRKASVFARSTFHVSELQLIAEPDRELLERLEQEELLVRDAEREGVWRFRHDLLRDVAYESLPKRERLRLHVEVADGLAAEGKDRHPHAIGYHLAQAAQASLDLDPLDRTLPDRAIAALGLAADSSRRSMGSRTAVDLYDQALRLAGSEESWRTREARLLAGRGESLYWLGEFDQAETSLERALLVGGDDAWTRTLAARFLADIALNVHADADRASSLFDDALAAAKELDDPWATARTLLMAGWAPYWGGDLDRTRDFFEEALRIARENEKGDPWAEARALTSLTSVISAVGDEEEALALGREALGLGREMRDPFTIAVAQENIGNSLRRMGRPEEALERLDEAVRIFRDLEAKWELASAVGDRGSAHQLAGRLPEAEADLRDALEMCHELGERMLITWTIDALVLTLVMKGETEAARRLLEENAAGLEPAGGGMLEAEMILLLAEGERERAEEVARRLLRSERDHGWLNSTASLTWWIGSLFGPEAVGGEEEMERARRRLESVHWIAALQPTRIVPEPAAGA